MCYNNCVHVIRETGECGKSRYDICPENQEQESLDLDESRAYHCPNCEKDKLYLIRGENEFYCTDCRCKVDATEMEAFYKDYSEDMRINALYASVCYRILKKLNTPMST